MVMKMLVRESRPLRWLHLAEHWVRTRRLASTDSLNQLGTGSQVPSPLGRTGRLHLGNGLDGLLTLLL